jgi:hypothetical protein
MGENARISIPLFPSDNILLIPGLPNILQSTHKRLRQDRLQLSGGMVLTMHIRPTFIFNIKLD